MSRLNVVPEPRDKEPGWLEIVGLGFLLALWFWGGNALVSWLIGEVWVDIFWRWVGWMTVVTLAYRRLGWRW